MNKNQFFKPTVLYKEYMILDMIEKNSRVTQREISKEIGIALSMVNDHLDEYEKNKLIKRMKHSTKNVEYIITKKGIDRKRLLNMEFLSASQQLYNNAKLNINTFLENLSKHGYKKLVLYGAGDVAQILLQTIKENFKFELEVTGIADDDIVKQGSTIGDIRIYSLEDVIGLSYDALLISSYNNRLIMTNKVKEMNIDENKIINFFD